MLPSSRHSPTLKTGRTKTTIEIVGLEIDIGYPFKRQMLTLMWKPGSVISSRLSIVIEQLAGETFSRSSNRGPKIADACSQKVYPMIYGIGIRLLRTGRQPNVGS